jgi:aldose 1-epimerase
MMDAIVVAPRMSLIWILGIFAGKATMRHATLPFVTLAVLLLVTSTACQPSVEAIPSSVARADETTSDSPGDNRAPAETEVTPMPERQSSEPTPDYEMILEKESFGKLPDGREVTLFTCINAYGLTLKVIDYGAIVVAVEAYDRNGDRANITLGFDNLRGYLQQHPHFGATVGRYGNRIAGGKFSLDGKEYALATNDGANHLHGGHNGLDRVLWEAETFKSADSVGVTFVYDSRDGEEGYPGNLRVSASYLLNNENELEIVLTATSDKPTPVNLTNHCYWNLAGASSGTILDHVLMINADNYLAVDEGLIPTGDLVDVAGTPFDFRKPERIGARIRELNNKPQGYDHCFVLRESKDELRFAARVRDPKSGRVMEIHTTQPGLQFYSGNFLDGGTAAGGFPQYAALCLETQHFPDSPNQPSFPSTIVRPGETYRHETVHKFSVE